MAEIGLSECPVLLPEALGGHIADICDLGNRFVGSPGEVAAREFLARKFEEAGLAEVRVEPLDVLGYRARKAACEFIGGGPELPAVGLQFTGSALVEAEALYLGGPTEIEDIAFLESRGVSVRGKIAVLHSFWPFAISEALAERGAVGLVVISNVPDGRVGHYTAQLYPPPQGPDFVGRPLSIPGVTIEAEAGRRLVALMSAETVRLSVEHQADYVPVSTGNVIGEIPGQSAERVVIGAHYDTQAEGVGACDNATGVAALLEIALTWRSLSPLRTVVLAAFADEEGGCWGSVEYCRRHIAELPTTRGMINLDVLAWVYPAQRCLHADPAMASVATEAATSMGWVPESQVDATLVPSSDVNPFIDAGVPACMFWRNPPKHPYYHALGDGPELLSLELVAETAKVASDTAFRLAQEPDLDLGRAQRTKQWLEF